MIKQRVVVDCPPLDTQKAGLHVEEQTFPPEVYRDMLLDMSDMYM